MLGRWLPFLLSLLLVPAVALAMTQSSVPPKFGIPWGNAAGGAYIRSIPQASQIGIQNCAASLTDGFPPLTFVPASSGGCPPFGQDMNGILKQLSQWNQWAGAGAAPLYDSAFSTSIGGYPSGATLANATTPGCFWISSVDNNATNPDAGGANWNSSCPGGGIAGTSTGSANTQNIASTPIVLRSGAMVQFTAGFTNTGPLLVNVNGGGNKNVFRNSQLGSTQSVGGEVVAGQLVRLVYDGTEWVCLSCASVIVGQMIDYSGTTAPAGWLFADGSCQSQTTYADLYAVASTNFGSCSAGSFAMPDARGTIIVGRDNQGSNGNSSRLNLCGNDTTQGGICGQQSRNILQANLPNISFPNTLAYSSLSTFGSYLSGGGLSAVTGYSGTNNQSLAGSVTSGGSGVPFITIQPVQFASKIVKL
jgi:microcystin-dependent protein